MAARGQYITRQKEEIILFLKENQGKHVSVSDICSYFKAQGKPIGTATVYRQLERLVDEGIINKYMIDQNTPACFEYLGGICDTRDHICFHCKCSGCGKLIHLHCEELDALGPHLLEEHGFFLDTRRTVLYGLCEECREKTRI